MDANTDRVMSISKDINNAPSDEELINEEVNI